ncbi:hypothetical protein R1sor_021993 [Riccia sorocarpa]|uniref:Uncharacterized protein n=1 Tax=Riccia sorocarpa TaxID=122646 RepID=A0ABD3GIK0_9MARC
MTFTTGLQMTELLQAWALYKGINVRSMGGYEILLKHTIDEFKDLEKDNEGLCLDLEQAKTALASTEDLQKQLDEATDIASKYRKKVNMNYRKQLATEDLFDVEVSRTKMAMAKFEIQRQTFLKNFKDILTRTIQEKTFEEYSGLEDLVLKKIEELRKMVKLSSLVRTKTQQELETEATMEEGLVEELLEVAQAMNTLAHDISLKAWEEIVADTVGEITSPTNRRRRQ